MSCNNERDTRNKDLIDRCLTLIDKLEATNEKLDTKVDSLIKLDSINKVTIQELKKENKELKKELINKYD